MISAQVNSTATAPEFRVEGPADLNSGGLTGALIGRVRFSERNAPQSAGMGSFWLEGDGAVQLHPEDGLLFLGGLGGGFSLSFWLFPATIDEGTRILHWQGRHPMTAEIQRMSMSVSRQRMIFTSSGLFRDIDLTTRDLELVPWAPLLPRTWSHHEITFDAASGTLVYRVNGIVEAIAGNLSGMDMGPTIDGLVFGEGFRGLIDSIRLTATSGDPHRPAGLAGQ